MAVLYTPAGENERLIRAAGFELECVEDATENAATVAIRWHDARARDREDLLKLERRESFDALQRFFAMVHQVSRDRRLLRMAYLARRPAQLA